MYQVRLAIGKSNGFEVQFLQVPAATIMPSGWVGLLIGENTLQSSGEILKRASDAIGILLDYAKQKHGAADIRVTVDKNRTPTIVESAAGLSNEAQVGASCSALDAGRTLLLEAALHQCWEVARETINNGGSTIDP